MGIVGANSDSKRFLREASYILKLSNIAVYDKDIASLEEFQNIYAFLKNYREYDAFLQSGIDAVYIASDIYDRYELIKNALLNDIHVLCENPISLENQKLKELFDLAKKKNKLLLMAIKTAFAPAFNQMLSEVDKIGIIKEVRSTFTSLYKERGFPKRYLKNGATSLLMSYPALLVQKVAGVAKEIVYFDQKKEEYDISNRAVSRHKNDIIGISTVGIEMKSDGHAIISGDKGYIYIPAPWWLTKEFFIKFEDPDKDIHFEYQFEGDGLRYMIAEFVSLIRRKKIESKRLTIQDMIEMNKFISDYYKG